MWTLFLWPVATVLIWGLQVVLRSDYYKARHIKFYNWLGLKLFLIIVRIRHRVNKLNGEPPATKIRMTWERKWTTNGQDTFMTDEDLPLEQL